MIVTAALTVFAVAIVAAAWMIAGALREVANAIRDHGEDLRGAIGISGMLGGDTRCIPLDEIIERHGQG